MKKILIGLILSVMITSTVYSSETKIDISQSKWYKIWRQEMIEVKKKFDAMIEEYKDNGYTVIYFKDYVILISEDKNVIEILDFDEVLNRL